MTEFRQRIRYHHALWRQANGHPIGTQPIAPRVGEKARLVGNRLPLAYARQTGASFLTDGARSAVRIRESASEPNQSFDHQRLWAELMWSPTLAFNLFGDLSLDLALADRALHAWWPDAPGTVRQVRFAHSPGRLDPSYLNSLRAFDAAFVLDLGDGTRGIVGVATPYFDWAKPETPRPENITRYIEVSQRSRAFADRAIGQLKRRSPFCLTWLEHLLLLSMLQHKSGTWRWGRYTVVHPAGNVDLVELCVRYRNMLADDSTFSSVTLEELTNDGALPASTAMALRDRYLPSFQDNGGAGGI